MFGSRLTSAHGRHVLSLREIIIICLEFSVTSDEVDRLDNMVKKWVSQYEE
jgi:hypothetical protein